MAALQTCCSSETMKLVVLLLKVALVESLGEVTKFVGDDVTLPSGAPSSWTLTAIEWSIFSNNTWIATYRSGMSNTERVKRYSGRLDLNVTTGDLTIHNLTTKDEMEYTVDLINSERKNSGMKTKLRVKQRLQKPTIRVSPCDYTQGGFRVFLLCSSTDSGVELSWSRSPNTTVFNTTDSSARALLLVDFRSFTQQNDSFTCTSRRNTETASSSVTQPCKAPATTPEPPTEPAPAPASRARYTAAFFLGGFCALLLAGVLFLLKDKIRSACGVIREKLCPPAENNSTI